MAWFWFVSYLLAMALALWAYVEWRRCLALVKQMYGELYPDIVAPWDRHGYSRWKRARPDPTEETER